MQVLRAATICAVALTTLVVLTRTLPTVVADAIAAGAPGGSLDELVSAVALVGACSLAAWVVTGVMLEIVGALPGTVGGLARRLAAMISPLALRRAVGIAAGVSVLVPTAATASRAAVPEPAFPILDRVVSQPAPVATAPTPDPLPSPLPSAVPAPPAAVTVTVEPGDSLWSIADAHLRRGAPAADIALAWPRWWQANRATIGDDPDLIRPGQVLTAPTDVLTGDPVGDRAQSEPQP